MEHEGVTVLFLRVAGQPLGVEIGQVETLRRKETLYPPRDGPPDLQGFLRLGERVVPVLDLRTRLRLPKPTERRLGVLIVSNVEPPLAFRVDRVEETIRVPWDELALLPELLRVLQPRPTIWSLARRGDELVPLLDLSQIVPPEETATLRKLARVYEGGHHDGNDAD